MHMPFLACSAISKIDSSGEVPVALETTKLTLDPGSQPLDPNRTVTAPARSKNSTESAVRAGFKKLTVLPRRAGKGLKCGLHSTDSRGCLQRDQKKVSFITARLLGCSRANVFIQRLGS